jgi:hypothetical protein
MTGRERKRVNRLTPLDDGWTGAREDPLQHCIRQQTAEYAHEEHVQGPAMVRQPEENGHGDDHQDQYAPGAECGDLEHDGVEPGLPYSRQPAEDGLIERLGEPFVHRFRHCRKDCSSSEAQGQADGDDCAERSPEAPYVTADEPEDRIEQRKPGRDLRP